MADSPEAAAEGPVELTVKVNGADIDDSTMIKSLQIVKEIGRIPWARFTIMSDSAQIADFTEFTDDRYKVGQSITFAANYGGGTDQTLFEGIITVARARATGRDGQTLELTCRDKALKMTETRVSALYEKKSDGDIIKAIISAASLTADVTATSDTARDQFRPASTDWDFVRLLADRNGMLVTAEAGKVSAFAPDTSSNSVLTVTLGADVIEFDASIDAERMVGDVKGTAWDVATQKAVTGEHSTPTNPTLGDVTAKTIASVMGDRTYQTETAAQLASADLTRIAKARLLRASMDTVHGFCSFVGSGKAELGKMIEVVGASDRFSGDYFVSRIEHRIQAGEWVTKAGFGVPQDWVSDIADIGAPGSAALSPPAPGLQVGKVVQIHEDPDNLQRIKVKLPVHGTSGAEVWARFAQPYASSSAGIQFMPEVDDEVIVAFFNDDPNAPVILGALHNAKAAQVTTPAQENNTKTIVTRTNMRVEFDEDKKKITVSTPGGHQMVMDDTEKSVLIKDLNGNAITMDASGISISSDKDVSISAGGAVDASATSDAKVSGQNVSCEGQLGFTGKGGSTSELSAGGQTTVKGAMVMIN